MKLQLKTDVFQEAYDRLKSLYDEGHRVVVAFSAGKDSGICLELAIMAARDAGRLPVEVAMRDEEIMFPGTFEYAERVANRSEEIDFHWQIAHQPVLNYFNRANPYWWVMDPLLSPEEWVRTPPWGRIPREPYDIEEQHIGGMINSKLFPPDEGKQLFKVTGLRTAESLSRRLSIHSSKGWLTGKPDRWGVRNARPIYDWEETDVWKAVKDFQWDYNEAYDVLWKHGAPKHLRRIAPPTMSLAGIETLKIAKKAWPKWFHRVHLRIPGIRSAAQFGRRAVMPVRRVGETWEDCFKRECIDGAPAPWIKERCSVFMLRALKAHAQHSSAPFPESKPCPKCDRLASWQKLAQLTYNGDPFSVKQAWLKPVEPEFFRPGAGYWGGTPTF